MKKIVFVIPSFSGGGAERVMLNYLSILPTDRFDVTLISINGVGPLVNRVPSNINFIDLETKRASRSLLTLYRALKSVQPDIVFTSHHRVTALVSFVRLKLRGIQHLARIPNMLSVQYKNNIFGSLSRVIYTFGYRRASILVAQTDAMSEDASSFLGIPKNKTITLHNPLDVENIEQSLSNIEIQKDPSKFHAVASGRLTYQKGFDVLIESVRQVVKERPDFRLTIIGEDAGEKTSLMKLVEEMGLQNVIEFKGFVDNPYISYVSADLFILSSRWEGFPNALLENYYLNTPIVATTCIPIIGELINDGENGFLCEVENVESLSSAILNSSQRLDRLDIHNNYSFPNLESLFN